MNALVAWSAGRKSLGVLAELGRTEDVMFSPNGHRLAVAGFQVNRIAVFSVRVKQREDEKAIRLTDVYNRDGPDWRGTRDPSRLFPAMDRALFLKGQHNPQEGGPKGIDIDGQRKLLVSTCETQTLAFFDLDKVLLQGEAPANRRRRFLQWRIANALFNRVGLMVRRTR